MSCLTLAPGLKASNTAAPAWPGGGGRAGGPVLFGRSSEAMAGSKRKGGGGRAVKAGAPRAMQIGPASDSD